MEMQYKIGQKVMVSPLVTHYHYWEEGTIIEVEDNSFNGIVLTVEMPNGDVFFERADLDYFRQEVMPFFVKPIVDGNENMPYYTYDLQVTSTIKYICQIIRTLPNYYYDEEDGDVEESLKAELDSLNKTLFEQKEFLSEIMPGYLKHGETPYDLEKQAMFAMRNKIIKILYDMEFRLQCEFDVTKLRKDGSSFIKGLDFDKPQVYMSHIYCPYFAVEYTMYLGETAEGKENLCTLLLYFVCDEDESSPVFYKLNRGVLLCDNYAKTIESNIDYDTFLSYIIDGMSLTKKSDSRDLPFDYDDTPFESIGNEVYFIMNACDKMIRDKKYKMLKPMPLMKMQSLMENTYAQAKYVDDPSNPDYNELIKEDKLKEKCVLKNRYRELYTLLHETMVNPYDYVDIMIEYGQVQRKLNQLGEDKYQSKWVII